MVIKSLKNYNMIKIGYKIIQILLIIIIIFKRVLTTILFRSDLYQRVERVLQGFIEENCPVNSRTIRIFLSSTFTGK